MELEKFITEVKQAIGAEAKRIPDINPLLQLWHKQGTSVAEAKNELTKTKNKTTSAKTTKTRPPKITRQIR